MVTLFSRNLSQVIEHRLLERQKELRGNVEDESAIPDERNISDIKARLFYGGTKTSHQKGLEDNDSKDTLTNFHQELFSRRGNREEDYFGFMCESHENFLAVVESTPYRIMDFILELHEEINSEDPGQVSDVKIFLYTDDNIFMHYTFSRTLVSRQSVEDNTDPAEEEMPHEDSDSEARDNFWIRFIHDVLKKLLTIGAKTRKLGPAQTRLFVESMTTSSDNLKLIPRRETITALLTQCDKVMTIDEFVELYTGPVDHVFDDDLIHPAPSFKPWL